MWGVWPPSLGLWGAPPPLEAGVGGLQRSSSCPHCLRYHLSPLFPFGASGTGIGLLTGHGREQWGCGFQGEGFSAPHPGCSCWWQPDQWLLSIHFFTKDELTQTSHCSTHPSVSRHPPVSISVATSQACNIRSLVSPESVSLASPILTFTILVGVWCYPRWFLTCIYPLSNNLRTFSCVFLTFKYLLLWSITPFFCGVFYIFYICKNLLYMLDVCKSSMLTEVQ